MPTETPAPEGIALEGSEWVLQELNGSPLIAGSNITLEFAGGEVSGYAGCNAYGGPYTLEAASLAIPQVGMTRRACPEPAGVMEQENAFAQALHSSATYTAQGDRLELADSSGQVVLAFARQATANLDPAELVGTAWQLTAQGEAAVAGTTITLRFDSATELSGQLGCAAYTGNYQARGDDIGLSFLAMDYAGCPDPNAPQLTAQESAYLDSLDWLTDYRLGGRQLEILTAQGVTLRFEALPAG